MCAAARCALRSARRSNAAPFRGNAAALLAPSAGDLCAQEALGTAVAAAIEAKGSKALYVKADLAVVDDVKNIIAKVDETFGKLHGLVNSAAVATRGDWVGAEAAPVRCTPRPAPRDALAPRAAPYAERLRVMAPGGADRQAVRAQLPRSVHACARRCGDYEARRHRRLRRERDHPNPNPTALICCVCGLAVVCAPPLCQPRELRTDPAPAPAASSRLSTCCFLCCPCPRPCP